MTVEQASDPLVVFGAPRSGTSYLTEILNSHPDVAVSRETRVFVWMHRCLKVVSQNDNALLLAREEFVDHSRPYFAAMIRDYYKKRFPTAIYWGDKNPHYAHSIDRGCPRSILEVFPGARFIHILRDGRDVVTSLLRKKHSGGEPWVKSFEQAHTIWMNHVDNAREVEALVGPGQYIELRYEQLVAREEEETERLFEKLGIDLHASVIDFLKAQKVERHPYSGPTRKDFGSASSEWSATLTPEQQSKSLDLIGSHLVKFDYETRWSLRRIKKSLP